MEINCPIHGFIGLTDIEAKIIKVTEIMDIMMYDVMSTPAIVIDEQVVFKGRVPSKDEVLALLI